MLGAVGFLILIGAISAFAYTSHRFYTHVPLKNRQLFTGSYGLLALAVAVWTITFFVPTEAVAPVVFMGDAVLLIATGCMLSILFDATRLRVLLPLCLIGAALLTVRAYIAPPTAYVADGLLMFNLSQQTAFAIGALFLAAWLPATIKVLQRALSSEHLLPLRNPIIFVFTSTILITSFFLTARRPLMIVLSFVGIIFLFILLAVINQSLRRFENTNSIKAHRGTHG